MSMNYSVCITRKQKYAKNIHVPIYWLVLSICPWLIVYVLLENGNLQIKHPYIDWYNPYQNGIRAVKTWPALKPDGHNQS